MASRRKFKKQIKLKTDILIEDAFIESINGDEKMDKLIDEVIDDRIEILGKVCGYPNTAKRAEIQQLPLLLHTRLLP